MTVVAEISYYVKSHTMHSGAASATAPTVQPDDPQAKLRERQPEAELSLAERVKQAIHSVPGLIQEVRDRLQGSGDRDHREFNEQITKPSAREMFDAFDVDGGGLAIVTFQEMGKAFRGKRKGCNSHWLVGCFG
jgi:hypothetical protein